MWWHYLLAAFLGGVVALVALLAAFLAVGTWARYLFFGVGHGEPEAYYELELIESGVRPGGVYVRYRNTGEQRVDTAHFKVRVFDNENRLIAESDGYAQSLPEPGATVETILQAHEIESEWLHSPGHRVEVSVGTAYVAGSVANQ